MTTSDKLQPGFLCLALYLGCLSITAVAAERLEYRFEVGDRIIYERRAIVSSLTTSQRRQTIVDQIQLWCFERNDNQALLLIDLIRLVDGHREPMCGIVLYIDQRGRRQMPLVTQARAIEFDAAFELLPVQCFGLQSSAYWKTAPDLFGRQQRCTYVGHDEERAGNVRIDSISEYLPGLGDVLGHSHSGRYWFDSATGLATRVEYHWQNASADIRGEAVTILRRRERKNTPWANRRAVEAQRYLQTQCHEDRLLAEIVQQPGKTAEKIERLHRLWAGRSADFDRKAGSPFAILCRAQQTRISHLAGDLYANAGYAQRWLGKAAVPWSLQNAAGQTLTSEQLRKGVTVECLWDSAAPHALATLELLRGVEQELSSHSVPVICLNLDNDIPLARRLIEHIPPGLTHVLAGPLRAVEPPPRLPIVRILDHEGIIRGMWIGWQPSYDALREEVLQLHANTQPGD